MGFAGTAECRSLLKRREKLEPDRAYPPIRHLIYLIDDYVAKRKEIELLELQQAQLDDRIFCAKEFLEIVRRS